jgi:hypothetical protein
MISRVKCLIMSSHGACCATCGGTTYPDPDRTLVFDLTLDGELPNGEILYVVRFCVSSCQGPSSREGSKV